MWTAVYTDQYCEEARRNRLGDDRLSRCHRVVTCAVSSGDHT